MVKLLVVVCVGAALLCSCSGDKSTEPNSSNTGTVTDIDGNVYKTVKIGDQWWMAENLRVTHYRDGSALQAVTPGSGTWASPGGGGIPNVTDDGAWSALTTGAYCNYNNDENNAEVYGRLYNLVCRS